MGILTHPENVVTPSSEHAGRRAPLSTREIARYSRHLLLPDVGMAGQRALKDARVLCVGAGGLGSPLLLYLAAAGVGTLGIVDFDVVDESNLQRQVLHGTKDVGRSKLESARARIADVNPHVRVELHETLLSAENALEIFASYDVIADGTDNFPTRYLVNDACVMLGKPNVYGSIFRFEGQLSVFHAAKGPCYRCLFREPPPPGLVPSCAEGGVLGVLPGIVGSLQALETLKVILGIGDLLIGRFMLFDALELRWQELKVRKDADCAVCGDRPTITRLADSAWACGIGAAESGDGTVPTMRPAEFMQRRIGGAAFTLVDVREPHEWEIVNLADQGARLIPLGELAGRMHELDPSEEIVFYCRSGIRSAKAVTQLQAAGFPRLWNMGGGILAWSDEIDPSSPKY